MKPFDVAILGAGSFGTAVAAHLAAHQRKVVLWGRNKSQLQQMASLRENKRYLPDIKLPTALSFESELTNAINQAQHIIIAVPSNAFHDLIQQLPQNLSHLLWLTKGLDPSSNQFLHELILNRYPNITLAILSGPSFAKEIANNLPTAVTLACNDKEYAKAMQSFLHTPTLRVYTSSDTVGVQLAGAMKNVLAIAVGISDGLGFGSNARAALITRGLHEMNRLGAACNADPKTFMGLTGLGDLLLTATDNQSRNRRFGLALGQGKTAEDAANTIGQVVEGQHNADQICALGNQLQVDLPICHIVQQLICNKITPNEAVNSLLNRPPTDE